MNIDGRIRDFCGEMENKGEIFRVYYCWVPVDDPESSEAFPEKIPSKIDKPFYEIYGLGYKKAIHVTNDFPTNSDLDVARNMAANRPDYVVVGVLAVIVIINIWIFWR